MCAMCAGSCRLTGPCRGRRQRGRYGYPGHERNAFGGDCAVVTLRLAMPVAQPVVGEKCAEIGVPSPAVPLFVMSRSLPDSTMVIVCSLGGVPVLYFDLAWSSFQVPAKGSAATSTAANPKNANASFAYRIRSLLLGRIIA